ncbi:hypothetical protein E2320_008571, partial [Naja naja]|jgi:hypothetical protein
MLPL